MESLYLSIKSEKAQKDYELVVKATKYNDQQAFSDKCFVSFELFILSSFPVNLEDWLTN